MRKLILLIFLFAFTNVFCQTENLNIHEISEKLCGDWILKEMKSEGEIMGIDLRLEVHFFKDQSLEMVTNGNKEKVTWKVINDGTDFIIVTKNNEKSKLISIDNKAFVISKDYQLELNSEEQESIIYYFERKE
ncbi:hypothetical protein [Sediminibacter sp. Hel_I_10]|uniref:hypothetical protein n=1 Tax=Sediminibacter sp. Hel_I_10 TaxID=1392490 RepID=UPI00047D0297|nr:hypothetical protein [Sediminibacter sp. Hel_I_10]